MLLRREIRINKFYTGHYNWMLQIMEYFSLFTLIAIIALRPIRSTALQLCPQREPEALVQQLIISFRFFSDKAHFCMSEIISIIQSIVVIKFIFLDVCENVTFISLKVFSIFLFPLLFRLRIRPCFLPISLPWNLSLPLLLLFISEP